MTMKKKKYKVFKVLSFDELDKNLNNLMDKGYHLVSMSIDSKSGIFYIIGKLDD